MKSTKFLNKMLAVFLLRVKPASQRAKPGCMKNTNIAANSIQTVSTDIAKSCTLIIFYLLNMFTSNIYIFCMNPDLISPALRCKGQCRLSRPCVS